MGAKPRRAPSYPYPFVGHGVGYARKHIECYVAFVEAPPPMSRSWIEAACPPPLAVFFTWTERGLVFASDDGLHERIIAAYPGEPLEDLPASGQWAALAADVDRWLGEIAERYAIAGVVWPLDREVGHETDAWHHWSMARVESMVRDHLTDQGDEVAWFAERATDALRASQAPDEPESTGPTLDDMKRAWIRARATGSRQLELRFVEQWNPENALPDLRTLWHAAMQAEDFALARQVCDAVLGQKQPARYQQQWLAHRVEVLLELGDLGAAREALPAALLYADFYDNDVLLALLRYCIETGDGDDLAVVFHAGAELGTYFKLMARSLPGAPDPPRPAKVMQRFAAVYRRWVAPAWQPSTLAWDQLADARRNFEKVHKRALATEIAAADVALAAWSKRAERVRGAFERADGEREPALDEFSEPVGSRTSEFLGQLAAVIAPKDPDGAEQLFRRACSFWRPDNATLRAYCELCTAEPKRSLPDPLARNLVTLARTSSYGGCALLWSALQYHRARGSEAEAEAIAALRDALECPPVAKTA